MVQQSLAPVVLALVVAVAPAALRAQTAPSYDRVTAAVSYGGFNGLRDLTDAARWRRGWSWSVNATYWLGHHVGVRAGGGWAHNGIRVESIVGLAEFNKFTYDANVVLRDPIGWGAGVLTPYAFGGVGAIRIHQLSADTWTKFAANYGAGIEYRQGRMGVRAEWREHRYQFDRSGFDQNQRDVAWQLGATMAF